MVARRENHAVRTAREAADAGDTRYFTGLACCHGHVAERMVRNGICVECLRIRRRAEKRDPAKLRAVQDRYRQKNVDVLRERDRLAQQRLRAGNPERERARQVKFYAQREAKYVAEAGRPRADACDICGEPGKTVFDHCHVSGKFRGWLCDRCNRTLGQVKDSPDLLRRLAAYLEKQDGQADHQGAQGAAQFEVRRTGPQLSGSGQESRQECPREGVSGGQRRPHEPVH